MRIRCMCTVSATTCRTCDLSLGPVIEAVRDLRGIRVVDARLRIDGVGGVADEVTHVRGVPVRADARRGPARSTGRGSTWEFMEVGGLTARQAVRPHVRHALFATHVSARAEPAPGWRSQGGCIFVRLDPCVAVGEEEDHQGAKLEDIGSSAGRLKAVRIIDFDIIQETSTGLC